MIFDSEMLIFKKINNFNPINFSNHFKILLPTSDFDFITDENMLTGSSFQCVEQPILHTKIRGNLRFNLVFNDMVISFNVISHAFGNER